METIEALANALNKFKVSPTEEPPPFGVFKT